MQTCQSNALSTQNIGPDILFDHSWDFKLPLHSFYFFKEADVVLISWGVQNYAIDFLELARSLLAHTFKHPVACDKLHNCNLPNESTHDLDWAATRI